MYGEDQKSYNQVASSRAVNKSLSDVISIYVLFQLKEFGFKWQLDTIKDFFLKNIFIPIVFYSFTPRQFNTMFIVP